MQPVPLEAEPADVLLDRLDVLDVLFGRVRVVEPQIASSAVLPGDPEVQTDRLGVTDVQIPVRLGRKPGLDAAVVGAGGDVVCDDLPHEIEFLLSVVRVFSGHQCSLRISPATVERRSARSNGHAKCTKRSPAGKAPAACFVSHRPER